MYYSKFEGKTIDIVKSQEYEFLGFPLVSHKDLLDAESFLLQIDLIKGDKQKVESAKFAYIKDPNKRGLTENFWHDFDTWKASFSHLDLCAELLSLSECAATQPKWFFAVSGALAKRNRDVSIRKSQQPNGQARVMTPSGNPWPEGIT